MLIPPVLTIARSALEAVCRAKYPQWDNPRHFGEMAKELRRAEVAEEIAKQPNAPAAIPEVARAKPAGEPVAWLRDQRDGYEGRETLDPLVILTKHDPGKGINGATYSAVGYIAAAAAPEPVATIEVRHHEHEVMEHQITLNAEFDEILNKMPHGTMVSLCVESSINMGHCVSSPIMTVLGGRVTTNIAMLPKALRTNRPTRAEADVAAEVIERLYAELQAARRDVTPASPNADSAIARMVKATAEADTTIRADAVEWLREDAASAREHDPNAGIRANRALADLFDAIADCLEGPAQQLNVPEEMRGELRRMAEHCGAVSYSPPPLRAVRGFSMTFEQLEAFAVLISGAVWPVPGAQSR